MAPAINNKRSPRLREIRDLNIVEGIIIDDVSSFKVGSSGSKEPAESLFILIFSVCEYVPVWMAVENKRTCSF